MPINFDFDLQGLDGSALDFKRCLMIFSVNACSLRSFSFEFIGMDIPKWHFLVVAALNYFH